MDTKQAEMNGANQDEIIAEVREKFPKVKFPEVWMENVFSGMNVDDIQCIPGRKQIRVLEPGKEEAGYAAICSDEYLIVPHEVSVHNTLKLLKDFPEFGEPAYEFSLLNGSSKMEFKVRFPEVKEELRPGDSLSPELRNKNSYDLEWEQSFALWAYQYLCSNKLIVGLKMIDGTKVSKKHRQCLDLSEMRKNVKSLISSFSDQMGIWKRYSVELLDNQKFNKIIELLPFGKRYTDQLLNLPIIGVEKSLTDLTANEKKVDAWTVHNAVTQFTSHEIKSELRQLEYTPKIEKVFESVLGVEH